MHEALHATGCQLDAYVLMDNQVHPLVTLCSETNRATDATAWGKLRSIVQWPPWPTGTLWEEQHKACLVESADYVLRCYRYIALNSVRGRLTDNPAEYRWARCLANLASAG